jgi:hypothetical protein
MKLRGIVKGQTIEFDEPLGLPEGQTVEADISAVEEVDLEQYGIKPIPAGGYVVTNEMVNEFREELGI